MKLSIVIPALNEEKTIPFLIHDIKDNNFPDIEIIIADNGSSDKTVEIVKKIAEKFPGVKLIHVTKKGVSCARNEGAKHATGEIILFIDADSRISNDYIKKSIDEFKSRKLSGGVLFSVPITEKNIDILTWMMVNYLIMWPLQFLYPISPGCGGIMAYKTIHESIKGFDENINFGEDHDYARRLSKKGKFRILRNSRTMINMRRFDKEGRLKVWGKYIISVPYYLFGRKMNMVPFEYEFGKYGDNK